MVDGSGIPICKEVKVNCRCLWNPASGEFKRIKGEVEFEVANSNSEGFTNSCEFGANSNSCEFVRIRTCIPKLRPRRQRLGFTFRDTHTILLRLLNEVQEFTSPFVVER